MRPHVAKAAVALALFSWIVAAQPRAARAEEQRAPAAPTSEAAQARLHAQAAIATMTERASLLMRMLREARAERRPARDVACVDAALTRADVAVRHAREDAERASDAFDRGALADARAALAAIDARDRLSHAALTDARVCMR
jgi:hypothetical protein